MKIDTCNIYKNSKFALIYSNRQVNLQANENWWGTTDEVVIRKAIRDTWHSRSAGKGGKVIIKPFLTATNPNAGIKDPIGAQELQSFLTATIFNVRFSQDLNKVVVWYDLKGK